MKRVLFVCMGNICRSPAAEGILCKLIIDRGLQDQISVESAGISDYHVGSPADERMRAAAAARGFPLTSRARQVVVDDLRNFDLVIAMDRDNLAGLQLLDEAQQFRSKIKLLSEFLADDAPHDVPDPYFGGG